MLFVYFKLLANIILLLLRLVIVAVGNLDCLEIGRMFEFYLENSEDEALSGLFFIS